MPPTEHPSREELAAFLVGTLPELAKEAVVAHLNTCTVCQAALAELDEGQGGSDAKRRGAEGTNSATQASPAPSASQPTGTATDGSQSVAVSTDEPTAAATVVLRSLGEYQLLEKMGHGGMGTVYKARHVKLKRLAAIKLLPPERMEDTSAVARFEREMEAVGRLNHPNIVQAYDAREIAGTHFLAMEFVDGWNLHEVLQRSGPLSVANACEVIRQAAMGLQYAHEHGLVHRDMKPSNLMLAFGECSPVSPKPDIACQDGAHATHSPQPGDHGPHAATPQPAGFGETRPHSTVKILDLGLALLCGERRAGPEMTAADQAMGTADYMAPEQIEHAHHVDIRADIYGLGCTLYKLLTGDAPFAGPSYEGEYRKMTAHLSEPVKPLSSRRNDVPEELDRVLERMLAKAPRDRYVTPGELAEALRPFTTEADLGRLAVTLRNADPARAAAEASRAATDDYRSSGYVDTESKRRRAHGVVRPHRDRIDRRLVATAFFFLGVIALGIVFSLRDGQQTVKVEIDGALLNDAAVTVWLDGKEMEIKGVGETIKLKPGAHGYQIRRGDQIITTREFTVAKGDNPVLKITVEGMPGATKPEGTRPPTASSGAVNYELAFDGISSYVKTPVKYDGSHPITLEAWVTIVNVGNYDSLISNFDNDKGVAFELSPERRWRISVRQSETEFAGVDAKSAAPPGRHHVALVFEGNQPLLFTDGLLVEMGKLSDKGRYRVPTEAFTIGAHQKSDLSPQQVFSGNIDEVRISRTARYHADFTPQERFEPDNDTLALYHFDKGSGDIAHDASGNGNDAKIVGAEWVEVGCKRPLPGPIARPAPIAGLGRWQVATRYPTSVVNSVSWSPDGALIACGDRAGYVRIYDARTLALVRLLPHGNDVYCVAWSPDGNALASSGRDGTARLWNADGTAGPVLRLGTPRCIAWHPDGKQLASGSGDRVLLWGADGSKGPVLAGHAVHVFCVAWSSDGERLVSGGQDPTVRLWASDGKAINTLEGHTAAVLSAAWSPDGKKFASGSADGTIRLWQADGTAGSVLTGHRSPVRSVAWSPDGTKILSCGFDGRVRVWKSDSMNEQSVVSHNGVHSAVWSPDGRQIASAGRYGLRLRRSNGTNDATERAVEGNNNAINAVACNPRTGQIAFSREDAILIWRPDGKLDQRLRDSGNMGPLAWSPDGQRLASGDSNAIIHLWTNDGRTSQLLKGHEGIVSALAWSADGQRLASGGWDKTVRLWSAEGVTGPVLQGHQDTVSAVAWHPDGMQLASASLDETVRFWEVSGTAGDVIEVAKGRAQFQSICWSPNGELLATGGSWGVELWQRDGKPGRSLNGPIENTPAVAWSPDSRCLASGHESGKVLLWRPDATSGSVLRGHMGLVNALAWPGNGRLISGDLGGTLRMWNVETGTTEWTAICLKENRHVTFSPTGEILHGHPKVIEEELVYLVEPPDGPIELLKPSEFKKRAGR